MEFYATGEKDRRSYDDNDACTLVAFSKVRPQCRGERRADLRQLPDSTRATRLSYATPSVEDLRGLGPYHSGEFLHFTHGFRRTGSCRKIRCRA
jgi:hypothetical protein